MLENPLIRFLGSAIALARLPAIEIFGSVEQQDHGDWSVGSLFRVDVPVPRDSHQRTD